MSRAAPPSRHSSPPDGRALARPTRRPATPPRPLADAILRVSRRPGSGGTPGRLGHMEDHQVVAYLAGLLEARGCPTARAHPRQVTWDDRGRAWLAGPDGVARPLDALIRFYQGEWLARGPAWPGRLLPRRPDADGQPRDDARSSPSGSPWPGTGSAWRCRPGGPCSPTRPDPRPASRPVRSRLGPERSLRQHRRRGRPARRLPSGPGPSGPPDSYPSGGAAQRRFEALPDIHTPRPDVSLPGRLHRRWPGLGDLRSPLARPDGRHRRRRGRRVLRDD